MPRWWNGRHAGLRSQCPKGRAGSSPALGTNECRSDEMVDVLGSRPSVQKTCGFESHLRYKICGYGGMVDPLALEVSAEICVSVRVRLPVQNNTNKIR